MRSPRRRVESAVVLTRCLGGIECSFRIPSLIFHLGLCSLDCLWGSGQLSPNYTATSILQGCQHGQTPSTSNSLGEHILFSFSSCFFGPDCLFWKKIFSARASINYRTPCSFPFADRFLFLSNCKTKNHCRLKSNLMTGRSDLY